MSDLSHPYLDRDLSWLLFNYRVLQEAKDPAVPLYDRIKFMAIYSSNLDEFFRVRVAHIQSLVRLDKKKINKTLSESPKKLLKKIHEQVTINQEEFGQIFRKQILKELRQNEIYIYYDEEIPEAFLPEITHYFRSKILAYISPFVFDSNIAVTPFLRNKGIYHAVTLESKDAIDDAIHFGYVEIPTQKLTRFVQIKTNLPGFHYVLLDDIINHFMPLIYPQYTVLSCNSIKLNKSADLNIEDEYSGDLLEKITKQLSKRDIGIPSRLLYDTNIPQPLLNKLVAVFNLSEDELVPGGKYHNFNDFMKLPNPLKPELEEKRLLPLKKSTLENGDSILSSIAKEDVILHFPYHSYDYVLRFFNEAAIDPQVEEIKVTLYRIAGNSVIANALISASKNGKKVTVFVELKARFDEENNIRWAKKMQKAGVTIIYSIPGLKVHAKVALVKRKSENGMISGYAFLGTGNFNESTASIYTDHGLLTTHSELVEELDQVFQFLHKRKPVGGLKHLLVAQFNMKERFMAMIEQEITLAKTGKKAGITIKLNNLEEKVMIDKLYEASKAGVNIQIINRGICCLKPGVEGVSESISVFRLVDKFLEHGRIFVFHNQGKNEMFLSSADWMKRNLYHRIEVGFPIYSERIKSEILEMLHLQLNDNVKLKQLNQEHQHLPMVGESINEKIRAQNAFYYFLDANKKETSPSLIP